MARGGRRDQERCATGREGTESGGERGSFTVTWFILGSLLPTDLFKNVKIDYI